MHSNEPAHSGEISGSEAFGCPSQKSVWKRLRRLSIFKINHRLWFQKHCHSFPAFASVIIRATHDLKPAIQSLHWLGAAENSDDLELPDNGD